MTARRCAATLTAVVLLTGSCSKAPAIHVTAVPGRPSAVAVAGDLVWVTDDERHVVHAIDARTGDRATRAYDVDRNPVGVASTRGAIWVAHASGSVVRMDARTGRRGKTTEIGRPLTCIAASGDRVWVCDFNAKLVVEIDARTSEVARLYAVPDGVVRVAVAGTFLWVTGEENTATRLDLRTRRVGPAVDVGGGPIGLAYDGRTIWVANSDDGTVSRLDARSGRRIGPPIRVGKGPIGVAVLDGTVYVANQDDLTVTRIDASSGRVLGEALDVSTAPRGLASGGGAVWVVGTNPSAAVRVDP